MTLDTTALLGFGALDHNVADRLSRAGEALSAEFARVGQETDAPLTSPAEVFARVGEADFVVK